jgi:hypothetical protein
MEDEYKALVDNGTWSLVPRSPGANVVSGKWIFKHKYNSDGSRDSIVTCGTANAAGSISFLVDDQYGFLFHVGTSLMKS